MSLADGPLSGRVLDPSNGQVVAMRGLDENEYPTSNMGAVAATRQAFLDALWWRDAEAAYAASPAGRARPRFTAATAALVPAAEGQETVVFETTDVLSLLRAARVARELKLQARFVAAGDEYRLHAGGGGGEARSRPARRVSSAGQAGSGRGVARRLDHPPARVRPRAGQSAVAS